MAQLQAATAALAGTRTVTEVAELAIDQAFMQLEATAAVLYLAAGNSMRLAAQRGLPGSADSWQTLPLDAPLPWADAIRTRQGVWIENQAALLTAYPYLASIPATLSEMQSVIALPLMAHGAVVGAFGLGFSRAQAWSARDRDMLLSMAGQVAQSLERAWLREAEEIARVRLEQNEARYRYIFEAAAVGIAEKDYTAVKQKLDGILASGVPDLREYLESHPELVEQAIDLVRVRDVNPAMMRLFGARQKSELSTLRPIFLAESRALFIDELVALMDGTKTVTGETPLRKLNGERIEVLATLAFPPWGYDRVLISRTDITEQKRALDERERLVRELTGTVRLNEMFAGILGHDLRNPLGAILTAAQVLLGRTEEEQIRRPAARILSSGERMARMIEQLLDSTRARLGGGISIAPREAELARISQQILEELEETNPQCTVLLEVAGDTSGSWDSDRMGQVISNLVGNACQHGVPNAPVRVELDGSAANSVLLSVSNQGEIPPEILPVLFDPFRSSQQRHHEAHGLGLGLFITEQIVLAHHGSIDTHSADGVTRITVRLPRRVAADPGDGGERQAG
jgi:signal transduction histidine kinase